MSNKLRSALTALAIVGLLAPAALACLWDSDTLQMERLRFPGVLEIITGKFVRHSRAYYEWRIKDRTKKLEAKPGDPALTDDLAVGYDKLGRYDEGIAVLEKSLAADPDRYETLANLATLLFHAGRLDESKAHVEHALRVNPDAHFGREKYQLLLTEYVLQTAQDKSFAAFVLESKFGSEPGAVSLVLSSAEKTEIDQATRGVLGMLHFADYEAPLLLKALGDLLVVGAPDENVTQLAARAYLRAAQVATDPKAAQAFRKRARNCLYNHSAFHHLTEEEVLAKLEKDFAREFADGQAWFKAIESQERAWIAANKDLDQEFAARYYNSLDRTIETANQTVQQERIVSWVGLIGLNCVAPLLIIAAIITGVILWLRRLRHAKPLAKPA